MKKLPSKQINGQEDTEEIEKKQKLIKAAIDKSKKNKNDETLKLV